MGRGQERRALSVREQSCLWSLLVSWCPHLLTAQEDSKTCHLCKALGKRVSWELQGVLFCVLWRAYIIASPGECLVSKQAIFLSCQRCQYEVLTIQKEMSSQLHQIRKINGKYKCLFPKAYLHFTLFFLSCPNLLKKMLQLCIHILTSHVYIQLTQLK